VVVLKVVTVLLDVLVDFDVPLLVVLDVAVFQKSILFQSHLI